MKQLIILAIVAVAAVSARPKYLVIPLEDVEFMGENQNLPVYPMQHHRVARSAQEEQEYANPNSVVQQQRLAESFRPEVRRTEGFRPEGRRPEGLPFRPENRRQGGPGPLIDGPAVPQGSFFDQIKGAIPNAGADSLAAGSSSYHAPPQGSDYVDYGAYTGKKGAFGWYSDHPVLLKGHGHH